MKLKKAYVQNFGILCAYEHVFDEHFDTVYMENGKGKSTFAAFIRAMFYGLPQSRAKDLTQNERARYTPWQGGTFGGWLSFEKDGKSYRIERTFGKKDTFALYDEDTGLVSDAYSEQIGQELFGFDGDGFEKSLCFSERSQQVSVNVSALQGKLVQMQDFTDYENAIKVLDARRKFYRMAGNRGAVSEMKDRLFAAEASLLEAQRAAEEYAKKHAKLASLQEKRPQLQAEYVKCEKALEAMQAQKTEMLYHEKWLSLRKEAEQAALAADKVNAADLPDKPLLAEMEQVCRCLIDHPAPKAEDAPKKRPSIVPQVLAFCAALGLFIGGLFTAWLFVPAGLALILAILTPWHRKPKLAGNIADPFSLQRANWTSALSKFLESYPPATPCNSPWDALAHVQALCAESVRTCELKERRDTALSALEAFELAHPHSMQPIAFSADDEAGLRSKKTELQTILYNYADVLVALEKELATLREKAEQAHVLAQEIANIKEKLPMLEENLYAIEMAKTYLTAAKEQLSTQYLSAVQDRFAFYVSALSSIDREVAQNRFILTADFEVQLLSEGATRSKESMSRGGKDLLALCLHLALSDALFEQKKPPLILDDPFIAYDDSRVENALALLARLSKERQIVYFVCHKSRAGVC